MWWLGTADKALEYDHRVQRVQEVLLNLGQVFTLSHSPYAVRLEGSLGGVKTSLKLQDDAVVGTFRFTQMPAVEVIGPPNDPWRPAFKLQFRAEYQDPTFEALLTNLVEFLHIYAQFREDRSGAA